MPNVKYITINETDYPLEDNATRSASKVVVTDSSGKLTTSGYDSSSLVTEAPSDNKQYARKNGTWEEVQGGSGGSTDWSDITNKPSTFPPSSHTHDDRYYTESEVNDALSGKANSSHTHTKSEITDFPSLLTLGETSATAYRGDRGAIAYEHSQAAHAPANAEANQNAFSNIIVGSTTIAADSKTDTFTLTAGSNVTLTPDATNDKITIAATDTTYSNKPADSGGTDVSLVTTGEKYTWNNKGTYSKPSDGIPKTDLAITVQTSLEKADTALQSHQDISGKENISNKVTSWSTTTTDTHYPSEKLVKSALDGKADSSHTQDASTITGLATVATSGSYSDLSNKPTIPTKTSQLNNDSGFITSAPVTSVAGKTGDVTLSKSDVGLGNVGNFKAVSTVENQGLSSTEQANARTNIGAGTSSFSGSYNDLSNKPTIPTVNNATLTIQKNGSSVGTFTANASSNVTANITVPTALADLSADATHRLVTDTEKALWNSKTKVTINRWESDD